MPTALGCLQVGEDAIEQLGLEDLVRFGGEEILAALAPQALLGGQLLEQLASVRSIASNDQMIRTFEAVMSQRSLGEASSLLGRIVTGTDTNGQTVTGEVELPTRYRPKVAKLRIRTRGELTSVKLNGKAVPFDGKTGTATLSGDHVRVRVEAIVAR